MIAYSLFMIEYIGIDKPPPIDMGSGHHDIRRKEKADECAAFVSFLDETMLGNDVLAPSVNEHLRKLHPYSVQLILRSRKRT